MGSVVVIMSLVVGQESAGVSFVEDQNVVTQLVAEGLDDPLALGVHRWCLGCGLQDVDLFGVKGGVERGGVLGIAVV
jgi:hypothetical protein